jgi:hypothetical protein
MKEYNIKSSPRKVGRERLDWFNFFLMLGSGS